jgi:hypothetical protein
VRLCPFAASLFLLSAALCAPAPARAETASSAPGGVIAPPPAPLTPPPKPAPPPERRWHLGVEALTDFPVQVGGKLWLEMPYRLRVSTSLGFLPGPYVDAINAVLVAAGAYDQQTADIIRNSLQSSLIFRLHAGWRPIARRGFYFEVGYGLAALGGGVSSADLFAAVTGEALPPMVAARRSYSVASQLHMIDVEIGWQWFLWKGLSLRTAIGFAGTLGAQTKARPADGSSPSRAEAQFLTAGEKYLDDTYTSYVFTPAVSLALGWRFF